MNTAQKTITETILNSFMIFREIEIISQEETSNGRGGKKLTTIFKEEESIYMLSVSKAGKTTLTKQEEDDKGRLVFQHIHKYVNL